MGNHTRAPITIQVPIPQNVYFVIFIQTICKSTFNNNKASVLSKLSSAIQISMSSYIMLPTDIINQSISHFQFSTFIRIPIPTYKCSSSHLYRNGEPTQKLPNIQKVSTCLKARSKKCQIKDQPITPKKQWRKKTSWNWNCSLTIKTLPTSITGSNLTKRDFLSN